MLLLPISGIKCITIEIYANNVQCKITDNKWPLGGVLHHVFHSFFIKAIIKRYGHIRGTFSVLCIEGGPKKINKKGYLNWVFTYWHDEHITFRSRWTTLFLWRKAMPSRICLIRRFTSSSSKASSLSATHRLKISPPAALQMQTQNIIHDTCYLQNLKYS